MEKQPLPQSRQTPQSLDVLILAAGLGTRMKSKRAKVLHELGGSPLIAYVCRTAAALHPEKIFVIVGHQAAEVTQVVQTEVGNLAEFVTQAQQRGTADAVLSARGQLENRNSPLVILSGDVPLLKAETLERFIAEHRSTNAACSILSVRLESPTGYGRIVRNSNEGFSRIVEQRDATDDERKIREINSGIYCFDAGKLLAALERVEPGNDQGEFYLTDVAEILLKQGDKVNVHLHSDAREVSGINTRAELAEFENLLRRNTIRKLMLEGGVTFLDPSRAYISAGARVGQDCVIYPDVAIEGDSVVGTGCEIHSGTRITNSRLGNDVVIKDHCIIVDSDIESNCAIGPFAHLRMNTTIAEGAVVGNFVELK
jgi:bifunctional UDP-N-acetylglucosamine pyrophosphorylase/glucosamine-1-phosphate N-acetyltransferase